MPNLLLIVIVMLGVWQLKLVRATVSLYGERMLLSAYLKSQAFGKIVGMFLL